MWVVEFTAMRIKIIDDNAETVLLLNRLVRNTLPGSITEPHRDPLEALGACRLAMPDLILVDSLMPRMNGLDFVQAVRAMPGGEEILIVMVTASTERDIRHRALAMGITDFLNKPIDPSELQARLQNLAALRQAHLRLAGQNAWLAEEVTKATAVIQDREEELIHRLATAAEFRDPETGGHILRMARYSLLIAQGSGLGDGMCDLILKAAPMHDVGKLGIPDAILLKPGRLDPGELDVMQRHPSIGHGILAGSASELIRIGAEIALHHHEKWDGTGYPQGLCGRDIALTGRIVAVADVFDALTTERPYKRAWAPSEARQYLAEGAGRHFDPRCVATFLDTWDQVLEIRAAFADSPKKYVALEALRAI